jgi:hypothetical protein
MRTLDREGLERHAHDKQSSSSFTRSGYCQIVSEAVGEGVFNEDTSNDMVMVSTSSDVSITWCPSSA